MEELLFGTEPIRWVQNFFGLGHPLPFRIFSLLGDTWGMLLVAGLAFWGWGRAPFYAVTSIVVVGAATKVALSMMFQQDRPEGPGITVYENLDVSSFPSGHVYEAVGPWGMLWVLGCVPFWAPALVAVLVSLGRLYLGTHFLGDVLAGVAFAAVLVWIYSKAWPPARRWLSERGRGFFVGIAVVVAAATLAWMWISGGTPRRYEIFGILIAGAVALPLEYHLLRERPAAGSVRSALLRVVLGLVGIVLFLLLDRSGSEEALLLGTWTAGLATLWAVLVAPALFGPLGLENGPSRHEGGGGGETRTRETGGVR